MGLPIVGIVMETMLTIKSLLLRMRNLVLIARNQNTKLTTTRIERDMKKNLLAGLLVIPLAFGLSSCGNDSSSVASEKYVEPEQYVAPEDYDVNPSDDYGYLAAIKSIDNQVLAYGSDNELLKMGRGACNALDSGETVSSLARRLGATQDTTEGEQAAAAVIAGAVIYLCPEYKYQADNL